MEMSDQLYDPDLPIPGEIVPANFLFIFLSLWIRSHRYCVRIVAKKKPSLTEACL